MPYIYLGRWSKVTDSMGSHWEMPRKDIGLGCLDLRSLPQHNINSTAGYGIFVTSAQDNTIGTLLGQTLSTNLTNQQKNNLKNSLGITALSSTTILDVLWELFNSKADIKGQIRWRPLMPQVDSNLVLHLGGFSPIRTEKYDPSRHPLVLEQVKLGYAQLREDFLSKGSDHYRRVLDTLQKKYKVPWQEISDTESPLPHSTTITETFPGSSATLGGDLTWTEVQNDMSNVSGQSNNVTNGQCTARAESALSSDDHYAQETWQAGTSSGYNGVAARFHASNNTFYLGAWWPGSQKAIISKMVAGSRSELFTPASASGISVGDAVKMESNGSTQTVYKAGASQVFGTDTAIADNLYTGLGYHDSANASKGDNFEAADLGGAVATRIAGRVRFLQDQLARF